MSGTRHEPQLLVARFRLEKRANHPGGDIIVGIAVDEEHRQAAFCDLRQRRGLAEIPPVFQVAQPAGRIQQRECRQPERRLQFLGELVPDARIAAIFDKAPDVEIEAIIVVAAPIEMPCTTIRVSPPKIPSATSIQCSRSKRSSHPMRIARPSLCPW